MKAQVKKAFKSYFFFGYQKTNKKVDRFWMKFSSTLNASVQQVPQSPISKAMPPYSVAPSSSKNQPPDEDQ